MPADSNKLSQFWQELKRRNVVRVITVYAGAAFVILELVNNITEPLHLPEWTPTLVIVLLAIGFPVVIIFSWIYDVHPKGGMVKTVPADKAEAEDIPGRSNRWKIASYISFMVIVGLIVLNVIPRSGQKKASEILDKSIAVLPFRNDSPDQERMYFINGTMESILDHLCKIEDMRVVSRNSVEQYRDNPKPTADVAEEMKVSYILEGSGHRDGNNVRIYVQLLDGKRDQHIWSRSYDADIEDIFKMQSEIAQSIAAEIEAVITPVEKQRIEKIPTTNLTAYDFYQRGDDELWKYYLKDDRDALDRAETLFHKALQYDSTFAQVYLGIADVHYYTHYWEDYFSESFLDSFLVLTNIALFYDDQLAKAYRYRGVYYEEMGDYEQAVKEYNKALEYNPNDWRNFTSLAYHIDDPIKEIEYLEKALSLNHGTRMSTSMRNLGRVYRNLGFIDKAMDYYREAYTMDRDTSSYLMGLAYAEFSLEKYDEALEITRKLYELDSTAFFGPIIFNLTGHHEEIYSYYKRALKSRGPDWVPLQNAHRIGVALWKMGEYEEAERFFNQQVQYCSESIELGRDIEAWGAAYYDLGASYACLGEKQKAIEYLRECNNINSFFPFWWVVQWKVDPLFENIRDEPEYQEIVRDVEAKYQAEHERVRRWLEENDLF